MGWSKGRESQDHGVLIVLVGVTPHQGARESRAQGEVAQVVGCPGAVRYARGGTPKQEWALFERCSKEATGELLEIERLTSSLERGHWKSTREGNSLVAYSTARRVRREVEGRSLADVTLPTLLDEGRPPRQRNGRPDLGHGDRCGRAGGGGDPPPEPGQQGQDQRPHHSPASRPAGRAHHLADRARGCVAPGAGGALLGARRRVVAGHGALVVPSAL